ncbi:hypothetical protein [Streptomyces sp. t39]|uniref:hypothetical protein n=1 Tax=Streptomyces sp. t39 TaxID=1828156 RepID=UPI0011CECE8F|nr:hypothetical protein [Streptomyces sp. t39]TXS52892.1 hypothetical protein EAO77_18875 [Streptomyces sp. t39]
MDRHHVTTTRRGSGTPDDPAWTGWIYAALGALAAAQLLAGLLGTGASATTALPGLVGVLCFPLLAVTAFRRSRRHHH